MLPTGLLMWFTWILVWYSDRVNYKPISARRGQTTPQMFRQFLSISHYFALLKKVLTLSTPNLADEQETYWQLYLREKFQWISKLWRHSDDVMFFATFEVFNMHIFLQCVRKSTSRGVEPWKNFVYITKIKWNMAFLTMKKLCKIWSPPLKKNPQIGAVILFQQMQLCCICDVPDY